MDDVDCIHDEADDFDCIHYGVDDVGFFYDWYHYTVDDADAMVMALMISMNRIASSSNQ